MDKVPIKKIITDPEATLELIKVADSMGKDLQRKRLATSQIRAIFGEMRQIEGLWGMGGEHRQKALRRLILLKPKMSYRARRERGDAVSNLTRILHLAVDEVIYEKDTTKQDNNFYRFVEFFEAILAYHKAHGGN